MFVGHWVNYTIDKPGNWFHGWKIPIFPRIMGEDQEALSFESFREILSDLNEGSKVNGDIEKHKAQELYFHFLIQYFPDNAQIAVLQRRFSHPNVRSLGTNLLVNEEGSLIWPPTYELHRRKVKSEDIDQGITTMVPAPVIYEEQTASQEATSRISSRRIGSNKSSGTVHRRSGESEYSATTVSEDWSTKTKTLLPTEISESTDDIGSLVTEILPASYLEQLQTMVKKVNDKEDGTKVQTMESSDSDEEMMVDSPPAAEAHITPERQPRLKRKSSTDDTTVWTQANTNPRPSKKNKSLSDHTTMNDQSVDEEMMGMFSGLSSRTDTEAPTHREDKHPLTANNLRMMPGSSIKPYLREEQKERVPVWLGQQGKKFDEQGAMWLKLAEATNAARDQLHGDDRELFERIIARRRSPAEVQDLISKWKRGELGAFNRLREEAAKPFDPSS